jgi:hypothetical protein
MRFGNKAYVKIGLWLIVSPWLMAQTPDNGNISDSLKTTSAKIDSVTGKTILSKPILPTYSIQFFNSTLEPLLQTSFKDLLRMAENQQKQHLVINFQHSTAYQLAYADYIRNIDTPKPEYGAGGGFVPIMPIVVSLYYGGKMGYQAIKPTPKLNIDKVDWQIWNLIHENPGMSSSEYYKLYFERQLQPPLTHFLLKQRLNKLENQGLVEVKKTGIKKNQHRYFTSVSVDDIIQKIDEELQNIDGSVNERKKALNEIRSIILMEN